MGTLTIRYTDGKVQQMSMDYLAFVTFAEDKLKELVKKEIVWEWNYR